MIDILNILCIWYIYIDIPWYSYTFLHWRDWTLPYISGVQPCLQPHLIPASLRKPQQKHLLGNIPDILGMAILKTKGKIESCHQHYFQHIFQPNTQNHWRCFSGVSLIHSLSHLFRRDMDMFCPIHCSQKKPQVSWIILKWSDFHWTVDNIVVIL